MRDLSVLIPSRQEPFLRHTIEDVLVAIEADTEIIAICDGALPVEPIQDHPRLKLVLLPRSIGQRAATNMAARLSSAKYVMKLDAHCRVSKGFDAALIQDCQPDWTMVPTQYRLHVFDWKCSECGNRTYQGPTPTECAKCKMPGATFEQVLVWEPRFNKGASETWRFDRAMHFFYWYTLMDRPEIKAQGDLHDTMSLLGACWFLERQRYWDLDGLDESHGSWGGMGSEIACKTWLSGGRLVVTKRAWFAHLFRTQGGDFGFPYELKGSDQQKAREYSQDLWLNDKWPKAKHKLSWLIDKFAPVPDWHDAKTMATTYVKTIPTAAVLYYTDATLSDPLMEACQRQLKLATNPLPIINASLGKAIDFGDENIIIQGERGPKTLFLQILAGLERSTADFVFFAEHDCLYPPEHFSFAPPRNDVFYYDNAMYRVSATTGRAVTYRTKELSGLCANRLLLIEHYYRRLAKMAQNVRETLARGEKPKNDGHDKSCGWEPGNPYRQKQRIDDYPSETYTANVAYLDIREHGSNWTRTRWATDQFRNKATCEGWQEVEGEIPGWGCTLGRFNEFLAEIASQEKP